MADPVVLHVQFEENGGIQIHWTRPDDHTHGDATYHTTLVTREGQDADEQIGYYADELRGDAVEFLMAYLKVKNRRDA